MDVRERMEKVTPGCRSRNGVVMRGVMASAVGIAAMRTWPESPMAGGPHLLAHRAGVTDDPPRPFERPLSLGREALIARTALHQHDAEHVLKLLDAGR